MMYTATQFPKIIIVVTAFTVIYFTQEVEETLIFDYSGYHSGDYSKNVI